MDTPHGKNDAHNDVTNHHHSALGDAMATAQREAESSASSSESHVAKSTAQHELLPTYRVASNEEEKAGVSDLSKHSSESDKVAHDKSDENTLRAQQGARAIPLRHHPADDEIVPDETISDGGRRNFFTKTYSTFKSHVKSKGTMARTLTADTSQRLGLPRAAAPVQSGWDSFTDLCARELNFYRIHLLVFTFTPLIFAGIFYASNTNPIPFIDCLFVCVSAMTVTGLVTINISTSSGWQQAILFFLMCIGNLSAVSITMVLIRRHFFRLKFEQVIRRSSEARKRMNDVEMAHLTEKRKNLIHWQRAVGLRKKQRKHDEETPKSAGSPLSPRSSASTDELAAAEVRAERERMRKREKARKKGQGRLRADMIRRMDQPAVLINPTGDVSHTVPERVDEETQPSKGEKLEYVNPQDASGSGGGILTTSGDAYNTEQATTDTPNIRIEEPVTSPSELRRTDSPEEMTRSEEQEAMRKTRGHVRRHSLPTGMQTPPEASHPLQQDRLQPLDHDARHSDRHDKFPRAQTIEFAEPPRPYHNEGFARSTAIGHSPSAAAASFQGGEPAMRHRSAPHHTTTFERTPTIATMRSSTRRMSGVPMTRTHTMSKRSGFGGFPTPIEIAGGLIGKVTPHIKQRFERSTTFGRTSTFASATSGAHSVDGDSVVYAPYLSFDAFVSRNSRFHELTEAQRDELGGVEYRAIDLLAKLLPAYIIGVLLFFIVLVGPWTVSPSAGSLHSVLASQGVNAPEPFWMWAFNVLSAYSNTGMSLIDTSMTELGTQYFMLIPMGFLILAGNTAFPIFLRFFIWCISLMTPRKSRTYETLRFLLDHPRRCFVYLFPSAQTWFLLLVLVVLNSTDWIFFEVLDLGNPTIDAWGIGQRIFDGLFQSFAVRAAGFQIISLLQVAPALQVLYIVMMYISAYPIAMSVRNTNVYEEKSLGIYNDSPAAEEEPEGRSNARVWGKYLAAHARRQLAFDMWWLGFSLWLVCIIERDKIEDPSTDGYFTIFSCLFELTSAYGTVGLSTGTPTDNFSLSGRFRTLSKLVVIAVMLRGRHRGLPVAIDRAVMLPDELAIEDDINDGRFVLDEDGVLRPRAMSAGNENGNADPSGEHNTFDDGSRGMPSSTTGFFPRSNTGASMGGPSRGMTRYLSRDKTPPSQFELGEAMRGSFTGRGSVIESSSDSAMEKRSQMEQSSSSDRLRAPRSSTGTHAPYGNFSRPPAARHLTAITEAGYSPAETPSPRDTPNELARHTSPLGVHESNGTANFNGGDLKAIPSSESSASSGSKKGKERESSMVPMADSVQMSQKGQQGDLRLQRSQSEEHEEALAHRFGCPADDDHMSTGPR